MRAYLLLLVLLVQWTNAQDCETTSFVDSTYTGEANDLPALGMDPSGEYKESPDPFVVDDKLVIEADINKEYDCSDHFFVFTQGPDFGVWSWGSEFDRVKVVWNCDMLYIYHPDGDTSTASSTVGIHHLTIVYTPTSITVDTDLTTETLSVTGATYYDNVYVWIGADDDESHGSDFANIAFSCAVGESVPVVNCIGDFGTCSADCEKSYHISTHASGGGANCIYSEGDVADCAHGEGACPIDCTVNTLTATPVDCFCGAATEPCSAGQFCHDDACHVDASHPDCPESAYDPVTHQCGCAAATICNPGRFCYGGTCNVNAHCTRPSNIDKGVFYGAKVMGLWDQPTKTMHMYLPIPGYFTVDSIKWIDAEDGVMLRYLEGDHGKWTIDNSDECLVKYKLDVGQVDFFGPGSRFTVNGLQMRAIIDVDVHTDLVRVHQGHSYHRERHVSDMLPVIVNLVSVTEVSVLFHTAYAAPGEEEEGPIKSVVILTDCNDIGDYVTLLEECQETYGDPAGLTCESVECSPDGFTQVNFEGEEDGSQQDVIEDLIEEIVENDWETETHGPTQAEEGPHIKLEPMEFVIFLEAHENVLVDDKPTITIIMETHSRGCVDHTTMGANMGAGINDGTAWIDTDPDVYPSTFTWVMDPDVDTTGMTNEEIMALDNQGVDYEYEWNLCTEIVNWTFTPENKGDGTYEITLIFDQKEDLPSFLATAEITIVQSDVLGDIGFDTQISLWEDVDADGVPYNPNTEFQIGEKIYSKIELSSLVVDTDSITCTDMVVSQYPEEADIGIDPALDGGVHDILNNPIYKFEKRATTLKNTAVLGFELDIDTFYLSVAGVKSVLDVGLEVTYKQGTQERLRVRRILHSDNSWEETAVGADDGKDYSKMDREPEQTTLSAEFGILGRAENMVGMMIRKMTTHPRYTGLFFFGIIAAALAMNSLGSKSSVQAYLLDEEF